MNGRFRVLCVDDDPNLAELSARQLEVKSDRIEATPVTSAAAGRDVIADGTVDCIVCDHEMPGETGLEFLRSLRAEGQDLPFILFTGKGSEEVASEAISAGVTDYLRKKGAEQYELLANRVENAVTQHRVEGELERTKRKLEKLHESAVELASLSKEAEIYEHTLAIAESILEFDLCGIYELEDGVFVPRTDRSFEPDELMTVEDGLIGKTYREGESVLVEEVQRIDAAEPSNDWFRSALSVPVGTVGVFQAVSEEPGGFTEKDLELTELLIMHVTEALARVRYEEDLRKTNEQLQAILDNTTAIIYIKDLEGRYTLVNDRYLEVLGMDDESEILGTTDWELQEDKYAQQVRANDEMAIERDGAVEVEERANRGGEVRHYFSVKVPIYDEHGDPEGVCGISSDITELKRREQELQRQKERLDRFASVVSHDLRNPLSVANGFLEMLEEDLGEDLRVEKVATALDRMEEILEDLLALAREGQQIGETEAVSVESVATGAWSNVSTGEATLSVGCDRTVEADPNRLQQVFENLFRNAVEHGSRGSQNDEGADEALEHGSEDVTVEVGSLGGAPTERSVPTDGPARTVEESEPTTLADAPDGFYVADDGPGVCGEAAEQAFTPGFSTSEEGTGFGLPIVKEVVEAHGWDIRLTESADGGARFEIETD